MRYIGKVLVGVIALLSPAVPGRSVSIDVAATVQSVTAGTPVLVNVTIVNNSAQAISYRDQSRTCDYRITVTGSSGAAVPETPLKRELKCGTQGLKVYRFNYNTVTLQPGESKGDRMNVSELYDLSQPEEYSIQISRTFPRIGAVTSNIIRVTVTPRN